MRRSFALSLSLVFATPAAAQPAAPPAAIEVELSNFRFTPQTLSLSSDRDYLLTLVNSGSGGHSFSARDFFNAARVDPNDAALVRGGTVEVPGGSRVTLRLHTGAAGSYRLVCGHAMHKLMGMTGRIEVR